MTSGAEMVSLDVDDAGENLNKTTTAHTSRKNYLVGISLLFVVVFLWTSSNFITQALFEGGYHKPFLVTYLNTSSFSLYLLPFLVRYFWRRKYGAEVISQETREQYETLPTSAHDALENPSPHSTRIPYLPADGPQSADNDRPHTQLPPLTTKETAHLASAFCFFWFIANWSVNSSLDYTSVASATILSTTSGFFTLLIGRIFRVEYLTSAKILAVFTSFIGVLLVALSDSSATMPADSDPSRVSSVTAVLQNHVYTSALLGDFLALLGAVFYALYVILLKVRIRFESRIDMQLFFGFVGLFNILALFPVGVLLNFTGHEPFELPSSGRSWGGVLVNMAITLSSDYIYVLAMLKTTPIVVTVGLSLNIPLAVLGDKILHKPMTMQAGLGALLVIGGFTLVGWHDGKSGAQEPVGKLDDELAVAVTSRHVNVDEAEDT